MFNRFIIDIISIQVDVKCVIIMSIIIFTLNSSTKIMSLILKIKLKTIFMRSKNNYILLCIVFNLILTNSVLIKPFDDQFKNFFLDKL